MLILKPNCEWCDKELAPDSVDAMICSYECTFCRNCAESILENVCPNCGGGFCDRPIRPKQEYRAGVSLKFHPASDQRIVSKYTQTQVEKFSSQIKDIPPETR